MSKSPKIDPKAKKIIDIYVGTPVKNKRYSQDVIEIRNMVALDFDYVSLDRVLEQLLDMKEKYGSEYDNLRFRGLDNCGCYYECHCAATPHLVGDRLETDLEHQFRIGKEDREAEQRKTFELKQLAALQKKYGSA